MTEKFISTGTASGIRIINLVKQYGSVTAVDNISLEINRGEFVTLLGPSGSGKTTTLMMIAGFVVPTTGDILVGGQSIVSQPVNKRNIGIVFQHYSLFPHMTVFENVAFPLKMRKLNMQEIRQKVQAILDLVELAEMAHRYPRQLSGGQQQRVALARALVFDPPILLMDEPLGALDKKLRESMQLEIMRIQKKLQITTVYVTHDQSEALTMSDRIAVMDHGGILQLGSPEQLYEHPASRFVADFIGKSNFLTGEVTERREDGYSVKCEGGVGFIAPSSLDMQIGEKATFAIRPEKLVFYEDYFEPEQKPQGWNVVAGVVESFIYLGDLRHYEIKLPSGDVFLVQIPSRPGVESWKPGRKVEICWKQEDARLV
ncbi:MAG: ABC transporter ATP-binding protein [Spirochaetaceae bacterium]|nr:MAG: ABC transporter ATP-binding protein [Spirochaetaceae bacterium]